MQYSLERKGKLQKGSIVLATMLLLLLVLFKLLLLLLLLYESDDCSKSHTATAKLSRLTPTLVGANCSCDRTQLGPHQSASRNYSRRALRVQASSASQVSKVADLSRALERTTGTQAEVTACRTGCAAILARFVVVGSRLADITGKSLLSFLFLDNSSHLRLVVTPCEVASRCLIYVALQIDGFAANGAFVCLLSRGFLVASLFCVTEWRSLARVIVHLRRYPSWP